MTTVQKCGSGEYAISYTTSNEKSAYDKGVKVFSQVDGKTNDNLYEDIDKAIKEVDSTTVLHFLSGFYSGDSHEGIIEYLDDENDKKAKVKISMEGKLNLIKSLVECAVQRGLAEDQTVQQLAQFYELYTTGELKDAKDFNNNGEISLESIGTYAGAGAAAGAGIGAAIGVWAYGVGAIVGAQYGAAIGTICGGIAGIFDKTTDDEKIDKLMKQLYEMLKNTEAPKQIDKTA